MTCPTCSSNRLTSIAIKLAPEEDHLFASCHACEWKAGSSTAAPCPLEHILSLTSERRF
jgi:hypothetical protein